MNTKAFGHLLLQFPSSGLGGKNGFEEFLFKPSFKSGYNSIALAMARLNDDEGRGRRQIAKTVIPEGKVVVELAILEYFLHESISLRLASLFPSDPPLHASERQANLKRAQYYSELIQKMLDSLKTIFGEVLPFDSALQERILWARTIGLMYFYAEDGSCWEGESRKPSDVETGIKRALSGLAKILLPRGGDAPVCLNLLLDAVIQSWILDREKNLAKRNYASYIAEFMDSVGVKDDTLHIENRLRLKCDSLLASIAEPRLLHERYSFYTFGRQLCNLLANLYQEIEEPIISRFSASKPDEFDGMSIVSQAAPENETMQEPFLTQPPAVLMASSPIKADDGRKERRVPPTSVPKKLKRMSSANDQNAVPTQAKPANQERRSSITSNSVGNEDVRDAPSSSQSFDLTLDTQPILTTLNPPTAKGRPESTRPLPPSELDQPNNYPAELEELCKQLPIVPASAFRQVLCRDQDELLANIIECKDPSVIEFIKGSIVPSGTVAPPEDKVDVVTKRGQSPQQPKTSMLDRSVTAERVTWSSNTTTPPKIRGSTLHPTPQITNAPKSAISRSSPPPLSASHLNNQQSKRKWSDEEENNLIQGYKRFGHNWMCILKNFEFNNRTNVDLKDKARNLRKIGLI